VERMGGWLGRVLLCRDPSIGCSPSRECRAYHHYSFTLTRHSPPTAPFPTPHPPLTGCSCTYSGLDVVAVYKAGIFHSLSLWRRRSICPCAACLNPSRLDRSRGPWARASLRQPEMYERETAEATKIDQDAAKATITFIESNTTRGSSPAMHEADGAEKEYKPVAVKTATATGAAAVEAEGRGDKRTATKPPLIAGVAPKVTKFARAAENRPSDVAVKTSKQSNLRDSSQEAGAVLALATAKDGTDAEFMEMEAIFHFRAGDCYRALEAVDLLGLQLATRK